jgi:hypothetical protein
MAAKPGGSSPVPNNDRTAWTWKTDFGLDKTEPRQEVEIQM